MYSNLTALYSIGKSVQGREMWVMVVSRSPYEHMVGKPNVKYVANMHGNEAVGRELMLHLILHLVKSYDTDYYIRWLLDNTRIHIMPSMNPDGFEVAAEGTCAGGQGRSDISSPNTSSYSYQIFNNSLSAAVAYCFKIMLLVVTYAGTMPVGST